MANNNDVLEKKSETNILDVETFNDLIVGAYNDGSAELELEADIGVERSLIPAGTGSLRDFSYIAPDIPLLEAGEWVGCMEWVTEWPDTEIHVKVIKVQ